jgi:hypothetical protein
MAYESLKDSPPVSALKDLFSDVSDLVRKEIRLAKAEIGAKLSAGIAAGIWMAAAGFVALIAVLLVIQALVFFIASFGIAMHWACLIVAGIALGFAGAAYLKGRSDAQEELAPTRTIHQIKRDIATAKEQLT